MNTILKIFDNIGFKFELKNNLFIKYKNIPLFNTFDSSHVGYYIPYLARNVKNNQWETGVGKVVFDENGDIVCEKIKIISSSSDNNSVVFNDSENNEFYLFANQSNFDTAFNNVIVIDKSISAYNFQAIYLVDTTDKSLDIILPEEPLSNLSLEVKIIAGYNTVTLREHNGSVVGVLGTFLNYNKFVYQDKWYSYYDTLSPRSLSYSENEPVFRALSSPGGSAYSFQYNDGSNGFDGADFYIGSGNNNLLLGSDSEATAHTIIPISGSGSVIFNSDRQNADFIVYGSGSKNMFFTYDGRLGLNIPSGSRPTTIFHVVNTICQEGFRLENRNVCHPANMTLYHKPNGSLTNNTKVSQINLSAKNSIGNKTDFAKIEAYAVNPTSTSEKGSLDLIVLSGSNDVSILKGDYDNVIVGYSGTNSLNIDRDGTSVLGYSSSNIGVSSSTIALSSTSLTLSAPNASLNANSIILGSGGSTITLQGAANIGSIQSSNITVPSIAPSSILATNSGNKIVVASGLSINSSNTISFSSIPSGKFLTTTTNGAVTGAFSLDDYFYTDSDILWNKYSKKSATICLKQLTFDEIVNSEEFSIGDQIAIEDSDGNIQYRIVSNQTLSGGSITELILDQNATTSTTSNFKVYSITKGGYLSINRYVNTGFTSNSSSIVLSIRPQTDTVFNEEKKDINFKVYGIENEPVLFIKANSNQLINQSGEYSIFATNDNNIFSMLINSGGTGINNQYSSANFGSGNGNNLFSGWLSDVGSNGKSSYYGTYDQNGNVSEWVEKVDLVQMSDLEEMVAGGSFLTPASSEISPTGLRNIEFLTRVSGYNDVGFRISSKYNLTDNTNISVSTGLNLQFVNVLDAKNISDSGPLYLKTNNQYSLVSINNLGYIDNFYRIGKYEITNSQYVKFLNAVAQTDPRDLYDDRMSSSSMGGINQIVIGSGDYEYAIKTNMSNKPVNFVSFISAIRFINWLNNGADWVVSESDVDLKIDTGSYNVIPVDSSGSTYLIIKNQNQKYYLPTLNQWHKAAYFKPTDAVPSSGISTLMIKRSSPYDVVQNTEDPLYASVSVSGWLYVDHLIVGDNIRASSPVPTRPSGTYECTTSLDCLHCEVCNNGFCEPSQDECCLGDCCLSWNATTEVCDRCSDCSDGLAGTLPCPPFCDRS